MLILHDLRNCSIVLRNLIIRYRMKTGKKVKEVKELNFLFSLLERYF